MNDTFDIIEEVILKLSSTVSGYRFDRSIHLLAEAARTIPAGVTSAARASTRPTPLVVERAEGALLFDADGQEYIDYAMGFGPLLLGHTPDRVMEAVAAQLPRGFLYGAAHEAEFAFALRLAGLLPCAESVILSNTGSEAVHTALRLARAFTGRDLIVKFEGNYHGWFDPMCYGTPGQAPISQLTPAVRPQVPATAGIAPNNPHLLILPFNDPEALEAAFASYGRSIAAIIMEGVPQAGAIRPHGAFLDAIQRMTESSGALFIMDEVVTGFRMGLGGAHGLFGVRPDLCVLGKAIGAGYPISAVAGRADVLSLTARGRAPHMGTFNGHAINVAAGLAALDVYSQDGFYERLNRRSDRLAVGMQAALDEAGVPLKVCHFGALLSIVGLPHDRTIERYSDLHGADGALVGRFAEAMLRHGLHIQARGTLMPASVHDDALVDETLARTHRACAWLNAQGRSA